MSMSMPKPDEGSKEWFRSLVPNAPGVEVRPMFGNRAAFVNKNMFLALFGPSVAVRLPDEARAELLERKGAPRLIERGVERHRRQHGEPGAFPTDHAVPQCFRCLREDIVRQRRFDEPAILRHLVLQLTGPPSGVSGEHPPSADPSDGVRFDLSRQEPDGVEHDDVGASRVVELGQDHG